MLGYGSLAANMASLGPRVQKLRWQTRLATGFAPAAVTIPKRFLQVSTWKGPIDSVYLDQLKEAYAQAILDLGSS